MNRFLPIQFHYPWVIKTCDDDGSFLSAAAFCSHVKVPNNDNDDFLQACSKSVVSATSWFTFRTTRKTTRRHGRISMLRCRTWRGFMTNLAWTRTLKILLATLWLCIATTSISASQRLTLFVVSNCIPIRWPATASHHTCTPCMDLVNCRKGSLACRPFMAALTCSTSPSMRL